MPSKPRLFIYYVSFSRLASAYCDDKGLEPRYTTWKHREDGEHIETLDYIFFSKEHFKVLSIYSENFWHFNYFAFVGILG
jgi:hypothetical protein